MIRHKLKLTVLGCFTSSIVQREVRCDAQLERAPNPIKPALCLVRMTHEAVS